jgi:hypothetical protein
MAGIGAVFLPRRDLRSILGFWSVIAVQRRKEKARSARSPAGATGGTVAARKPAGKVEKAVLL